MYIKCLTSLTFLAAVLAQPVCAQTAYPLLNRVINTPQAGPNYAFEMKYEDSDVRAHAFVNPERAKGERIDVIVPEPHDWNSDFKEMLAEFDTAPMKGFWCSDFLTLIGPDVRPVIEKKGVTVFAFTPQPRPDDDADDRKFLSHMIAHLTINQVTSQIQKFEMRNRRPFKPIFIAKIKSFHMEAICEVSPDGRPYVADLRTNLKGKIALKKIEEHEKRQVFNLAPPSRTYRAGEFRP